MILCLSDRNPRSFLLSKFEFTQSNCITIIDFYVQDFIIDVHVNSYNSVTIFKVITNLTEQIYP